MNVTRKSSIYRREMLRGTSTHAVVSGLGKFKSFETREAVASGSRGAPFLPDSYGDARPLPTRLKAQYQQRYVDA